MVVRTLSTGLRRQAPSLRFPNMSSTAATGPTESSDTPAPSTEPGDAPPTRPAPTDHTPREPRATRLTWLAYLTRAGLAVLALGVGAMIFAFLASGKTSPSRHEAGASYLTVRALEASRRPVSRVWEGYGTARALDAAEVRAEVGGTVVERPASVEAGAPIREGETIIRIEPLDYEQRVEATQRRIDALRAQLSGLEVEEQRLTEQADFASQEEETARRDVDRVRNAQNAGAGSAGELDQAEAALLRAQRTLAGIRQQLGLIPSRRAALEAQLLGEQANLRIERENLLRTQVTSPLDGVIEAVDFERGEWVAAAQRVARIVDLSRIEIPLRLAKSSAGSVRVGDRVELAPDAMAPTRWEGTVVRISPTVDASTRTIEVFVVVEQDTAPEGGLLRPGQFVVGRVWTRQTESRIVLPRRAIVADRVMLGDPVEADDPALAGVDASLRATIRRVRPVEVRVDYHLGGAFTDADPSERDWAVLDPATPIEDGSIVILSNLDQLIEGMFVRTDAGNDTDGTITDGGG